MHSTPLDPDRVVTSSPVRAAAGPQHRDAHSGRIRLSGGFALLLLCVALFAGVRLILAAMGLEIMGMAEYSALIPVVAAAVLPLRQTLIVGVANLAAATAVYGILLRDMSRRRMPGHGSHGAGRRAAHQPGRLPRPDRRGEAPEATDDRPRAARTPQ
ncbi:hypothetical protein [Streptomyces sp. NPDC047009]|uniref:hypothetical protein n=1 Tax=Streptomyces sp. NPDC047009 TaxID=3154496 RepID=UPI003403ABE7